MIGHCNALFAKVVRSSGGLSTLPYGRGDQDGHCHAAGGVILTTMFACIPRQPPACSAGRVQPCDYRPIHYYIPKCGEMLRPLKCREMLHYYIPKCGEMLRPLKCREMLCPLTCREMLCPLKCREMLFGSVRIHRRQSASTLRQHCVNTSLALCE